MMGSVVAVALFLVVGVAGVMTALRQREVAGPVAPNAPASIPMAAGNVCSLEFNITATPPPETPGPTPTPTPPPTAPPVVTVECVQKNAFLVGANNSITDLTPNSSVAGDSLVKYELRLSASGTPANPIVLEDQLAANTTWDTSLSEPPIGVAFENQGGNKLKITIQPFEGTKVIPYYVKVAQRTQPFTFTNNAKVVNNGSGVAGNACTISLKTSPSGVAVCSAKTAYTMDASSNKTAIANNGTVKAGTEYYYNIKVEANGETTGAVTVKDTLPAGVEFVSAVDPTNMTTSTDANGRTVVSATLGTIGSDATEDEKETVNVTFKVKLNANANLNPTTLKNTALISTAGVTTTSSCDHNIIIPPEGVASCLAKEMYTGSYNDSGSTKIGGGSSLTENSEFYYRFKVTADKQTTGAVNVIDKVPSALEVVSGGDFTNVSGQMVATIPAFSGEKTVEMKVKIKPGVQGSVTNTAYVDTENSNEAAVNCEATFTVPSYTCNSTCESDEQCTRADSNFRCVSTTDGKRCRLGSNHESVSCTNRTSTPAPSATPTVGCNYTCATNADCTNSAHICYQTANGGRCRLDANVTSETCTMPVASTPSTPAQPGQPVLPEELPQTGPEDWVNWLKAGLVTLGIGAILLLLL